MKRVEAYRAALEEAAKEIVGSRKVYARSLPLLQPSVYLDEGVLIIKGFATHRIHLDEIAGIRLRKWWEGPIIFSWWINGIVLKTWRGEEFQEGLAPGMAQEFIRDVNLIRGKVRSTEQPREIWRKATREIIGPRKVYRQRKPLVDGPLYMDDGVLVIKSLATHRIELYEITDVIPYKSRWINGIVLKTSRGKEFKENLAPEMVHEFITDLSLIREKVQSSSGMLEESTERALRAQATENDGGGNMGTGPESGVNGRTDSTSYELLISPSVLHTLPSMVRGALSKLPPLQQEQFMEEYRRKKKSIGIAYLLWFLLSLHYVYLGRWGLTLLMWLTFGGFVIWWLIDIFRIPGMVSDYNKDVAVDVIRTLKALSP